MMRHYLNSLSCLFCLSVSVLATELNVEIAAGGHSRLNCPLVLQMPKSYFEGTNSGSYQLVDADGKSIALQRSGPRQLVGVISEELPAGSKRQYRLTKETTPAKERVVAKDDGTRLTVQVDGQTVFCFNHGRIEAPAELDELYGKSGYIHPVMTPQGHVVTGDFEPDHPHQHGVFMAWVKARHRGKEVDFWNQAKQTGGVRFRRFRGNAISGPVFCEFTAELEYFVAGDQTKAVIRDRWTVRTYATHGDHFLIDLKLSQVAKNDTVLVEEYHYGGFAMRGPGEWLAAEPTENESQEGGDPVARGDFITSSGRTRADGNHTRARWVEMHGPRGSQHAGLIALAAIDNFRGPQTVRLHGSKPYFCFAPMVNGPFTIDTRPYSSHFRLAPHDGGPDPQLAERLWQDLAHPVKVRVTGKTREDES